MPEKLSVDTLVKRFEIIRSNRKTKDNTWQNNAHYCLPTHAIITETREPGTKLKTDIYDSTAQDAVPIASSGLHSYMTNPSSRWAGLKMKNKALMEDTEVRDWLKESEDTIFDYLNDSNFNEVITEWYIDFFVYGNATLYEEEDPEDTIRFFVRPPVEIYFLANAKGRIDMATVEGYRIFRKECKDIGIILPRRPQYE